MYIQLTGLVGGISDGNFARVSLQVDIIVTSDKHINNITVCIIQLSGNS